MYLKFFYMLTYTLVCVTHTHTTREYKPFCFSRSPRRSRANRCLSSILLKSNESATKTTVKQQSKLLCNRVKRLMKREPIPYGVLLELFQQERNIFQCVPVWLTWFDNNIVTGAVTGGCVSQDRSGSGGQGVGLPGACGTGTGGWRRSAILWFILGVRY